MPDSLINYTANGWPYLDANNYVEVIPQYTDELAAKLNTAVTDPAAQLDDHETRLGTLEARGLVLTGPGRPDQPTTTDGVITGNEPAGAVYLSTDAPNGAMQWQKIANKWVLTLGNTGWRVIPAAAPFTGNLNLRRVNDVVYLVPEAGFAGGTSGAPNGSVLLSVPTGFAPTVAGAQAIAGTRNGADGDTSRVLQGYVMYGSTLAAGHTLRFSQSWPTVNPWPTGQLPGVAL